jgi:hypothetical protein
MKICEPFLRTLAIALLGTACGSGGAQRDAPSMDGPDVTWTGHPACATFTAGGGDPVGTWAAVALCIAEDPRCPGATIDTSAVQVSGGFTFGADQGYSSDLVLGGTIAMTRPLSCLPSGTTCADLRRDEVPCVVVGDACRCDAPAPPTTAERGTWSMAGTSLTTTPTQAPQGAVTAEYDVGKDVLVMRSSRAERSLVLTPVGSR